MIQDFVAGESRGELRGNERIDQRAGRFVSFFGLAAVAVRSVELKGRGWASRRYHTRAQ